MIDLESVRNYCLKKKGNIAEEFPFDDEVLVFKVFAKIFLLTNINGLPFSINIKCEAERAVELRERFTSITPAWHMNKKMWNTVVIDRTMKENLVYELIDHSYDEVVKKLPKKVRDSITK